MKVTSFLSTGNRKRLVIRYPAYVRTAQGTQTKICTGTGGSVGTFVVTDKDACKLIIGDPSIEEKKLW